MLQKIVLALFWLAISKEQRSGYTDDFEKGTRWEL